jgi:hypothetical protein
MPCASELRADIARARAVEMRMGVNFIADGLDKSYSVQDDKPSASPICIYRQVVLHCTYHRCNFLPGVRLPTAIQVRPQRSKLTCVWESTHKNDGLEANITPEIELFRGTQKRF